MRTIAALAFSLILLSFPALADDRHEGRCYGVHCFRDPEAPSSYRAIERERLHRSIKHSRDNGLVYEQDLVSVSSATFRSPNSVAILLREISENTVHAQLSAELLISENRDSMGQNLIDSLTAHTGYMSEFLRILSKHEDDNLRLILVKGLYEQEAWLHANVETNGIADALVFCVASESPELRRWAGKVITKYSAYVYADQKAKAALATEE